MLNTIGRLDNESRKELKDEVAIFFKLLDEDKKAKAEKKLFELSNTQNYFIREFVGKELIHYRDQRRIKPLATKMLKHKMYGIRATALFYFYKRYIEEEEKVLDILEQTFESTPWEVESIINDLWKKHPDLMKSRMTDWVVSKNSKKRALSFHGMENIANSDPGYIMNFVGKAIDDDNIDVQKKITHILTQVARANPVIVFPYIREWLADAEDQRIKTIWVSMKKLANIVNQRNRRDRHEEFVVLTQQTIEDWVSDDNENVSNMGERLARIIRY